MQTFRLPVVLLLLCGVVLVVWFGMPKAAQPIVPERTVTEWDVRWIDASEASGEPAVSDGPWHSATVSRPLTTIPDGAVGAWIRLTVPASSEWRSPGLYIQRLYGLDYTVYENGEAIFRASRGYDFERNIALVPLTANSAASEILIRIESKERAGIGSPVRVGAFDALSSDNVRAEMPNLLLGAAISFLGIVMLAITGLSLWKHRKQAAALSLFVLSTGMLIASYSSLPFYYYPELGRLLLFVFDAAMLVLFPSLFYFSIHLYEHSAAFFKKPVRWLIGYYLFCFLVLIAHLWVGESFYFFYKLFTFYILAPLIVLQLLVTIGLAFRNAFRGNRDSLILSSGILGLAISGIADLVLLSVLHRPHVFYLWKFGLVFLILSLVLVLVRRIAADYSTLLAYSRELELHSHHLQKTERMRVISDLAASIAHEIRNPLQVTRGFLQLLLRRADDDTKGHYTMAISELDRASVIISDFLTFARPEQDSVAPMDVKQELCNIETIMGPMVMLHGGTLRVQASDRLLMLGNVSKFKQAIINMIKNSIESFQEQGNIEVHAYAEGAEIVIRIADNGLGMDAEQIAKLGEPYFSTKTKGTGLGLMVTFRIIEVMKGTLEFRSEKGKGTEAIVRFPLIRLD
ncbi:sensor histidine kinase [Paenibacillus antri]|uniref:histidine kinase n=1 Tax=Paenibacillus antri TaxID=2582848 RepID=A0A5R9GET7_9BACL|nr:sensor histidine kinase [Paenibacillus antri]TLS51734.1 sensor histidine kinase [Paenibacillus antri]